MPNHGSHIRPAGDESGLRAHVLEGSHPQRTHFSRHSPHACTRSFNAVVDSFEGGLVHISFPPRPPFRIAQSMQIKARDAAARGGRAAAGAFDHEGMRVADVKCPVRGCNKTVTAPSLQDNLAIAARLRRLERAAAAGGGGGGGGAGAAAGAGAGAGSGAAAAGGAGGSKGSKRSKPAASTGEEEEGEEGAEGATSNNQQNKRARSSGAKSKKQEGEEEEDNGEEGGEDDDDFGEDLTQHPARRG